MECDLYTHLRDDIITVTAVLFNGYSHPALHEPFSPAIFPVPSHISCPFSVSYLKLRSSSGYGNSSLSLHWFPLDRLPLPRKYCECGLKNCEVTDCFLQFLFFQILLKGSLLGLKTILRDFGTILSSHATMPRYILNVVFSVKCSSRDREAKEVYFGGGLE